LVIENFKKWHKKGVDVNACIQKSVDNEWQGIFEPTSEEVKPEDDGRVLTTSGIRYHKSFCVLIDGKWVYKNDIKDELNVQH
jgi:hypothetical protein